MIMPKEKREIEKKDITPLEIYSKNRKEIRKNILEYKKIDEVLAVNYAFAEDSLDSVWGSFD